MQVVSLRWLDVVGAGRYGCCTFALYRVWLLTLKRQLGRSGRSSLRWRCSLGPSDDTTDP